MATSYTDQVNGVGSAPTPVDAITGNGETVAYKAPCRVATTSNIALTGLQTVDGVSLAVNDRVLVRAQTNPVDNGIWIVSTGAWTRSRDFNTNRDITKGTRVTLTDGSTLSGKEYQISSANPITVGSSNITFVETLSSDAGSSAAAAAASAGAAATSETNAATSETNAGNFATAASGHATAAANSVGALHFAFSTTTADADPGAGVFQLNHATIASATAAFVDNVDADGSTVTAILDSWDDSTSSIRGELTIRAKADATIRHVFRVTGSVVDGTGYRKLTLSYVGGSGALTDTLPCWLVFDPKGDKGDAGDMTFANDVLDEDNMASDSATKLPTQQSVKAYADTKIANSLLTTRGDIIFRNATAPARLAASTAGYHLQTNGAGTDPTWAGFAQPVGSSPSTRTWQSKASDYVSILDYGAIGDGNVSNASANATALTNALATGKKVWIPYTAAGYHFGTNQITVGTGHVIEGENQVLLKSTATTSLFLMSAFFAGQHSGIHNVLIDMTGSGASSTAIRFRTGTNVVYGVRLSQIVFQNCVEAIGDEVHATTYIVDCMFTDIMCWKTRGRQVYIRRSRGFFLFRDFLVDFTQNTGLVSYHGIHCEDFAGIEMERTDVVGWGVGTKVGDTTKYGIYLNNGVAAWLTRTFADSTIGIGIYLSNITFLFTAEIEAGLQSGFAIVIYNVSRGVLNNTIARGNVGTVSPTAGSAALYVESCSDLVFTGVMCDNSDGAGLYITSSSRLTVLGLMSRDNTYGIALAGTTNQTLVSGGSLASNTIKVSNTATGIGNVIKDIAGYNGHKTRVTTTAAKALTNNITTAQSIFDAANDTVSVEASTAYRFKAQIRVNTGATSHTTSFGFGGTATFTSIAYKSVATSSVADTLATPQMRRVATASAAVLTAASTAVTTDIEIEGIMRINATGTIIPQVTFSAGPTGTCEVAANSFFEFEAIGPTADAADGGGWS